VSAVTPLAQNIPPICVIVMKSCFVGSVDLFASEERVRSGV